MLLSGRCGEMSFQSSLQLVERPDAFRGLGQLCSAWGTLFINWFAAAVSMASPTATACSHAGVGDPVGRPRAAATPRSPSPPWRRNSCRGGVLGPSPRIRLVDRDRRRVLPQEVGRYQNHPVQHGSRSPAGLSAHTRRLVGNPDLGGGQLSLPRE